ncbi:MAG: KEOPS complex subunit Pcc1 [Thermoplasmataceae archaeon]
MEVSVEIEFDDPDMQRILPAISPDNDNAFKISVSGSHATINISRIKVSSLYNVIDDLIRDLEVVKKVESDI